MSGGLLLAAANSPYGMIGVLFGLLVVGLLAVNWTSRTGTIARGTLKEAIRQPAFVLTLTFTILFLIALKYIPFFAGKDETKFYIECCLATILMSGMSLGIWLASTSVADEIEGKTAMTLLSKPINRRQFVIGKYLGILQSLLLLVLVCGTLLYFFTYEKTGYDAREASSGRLDFVFWTKVSWLPFQVPTAVPQRWEMAIRVIPGLSLIFMEIAVMTAISVAISTPRADDRQRHELPDDLRRRALDDGARAVDAEGSGVRDVRGPAAGDGVADAGIVQHGRGHRHRTDHPRGVHRVVRPVLHGLCFRGDSARIHPV